MTEPPQAHGPKKKWSRLKLILVVLGGLFLLLVAAVFALPFLPHSWLHECHHSVEAVEGLDKIKSGARHFYVTERLDSQGNPLPRRFPRSAPLTPPKPNCDKAVTPKQQWDLPGWKELKFYIEDPHYYSFQFHSAGTGSAAVYTARSYGNLDCDEELASFEVRGSVDKDGTVKVLGPIVSNEIE